MPNKTPWQSCDGHRPGQSNASYPNTHSGESDIRNKKALIPTLKSLFHHEKASAPNLDPNKK